MKASFYSRLRTYMGRRRRMIRLHHTYERFRSFTMIPRDIYLDNLRLAESMQGVPGCVVECGVWRGGMSAGIATVLGPERHYFLFDSFEGLPPAKAIDGESALRWQGDTRSPIYYDNCAASPEYSQQAMSLSGARHFHLIKGWFNDTVPKFAPPQPIALLRLDGDWYDSTMICLESFFDRVAPKGLIVLDDYYAWDGCSRALHDFLSRRTATERIRNHGEICVLEKREATTPK
jgi:O-methyltransferase